MKVNPISNINYKGLFTDKSKEHNGDWRMEYRPYSWEVKMAPKKQIEWTDSVLPDNEEIFTKIGNRETSEDIFGTISYIKDTEYGKDILRRTIIEEPSMTLEESLKVQDRKLSAFLNMKREEMERIKNSFSGRMAGLFDLSKEHNKYASDLNNGFFARVYDKSFSVSKIKQTFDKMTQIAEENGNNLQDYILLDESSIAVNKAKKKIAEELSKIQEAVQKSSLIDISRRDIENPNLPLIRFVPQILNESERFFDNILVALSHRTISVAEIRDALKPNLTAEKIINYVETLMKKRA